MECSGVGTGHFNNSVQINNLNFKVRISDNDGIRGSLKCIVPNFLLIEELKDKVMTIIGTIHNDNVPIQINHIMFSQLIDDGIGLYEGHAMEGEFTADEVIINQYLTNKSITEELFLEAGILGMHLPNIFSQYEFEPIKTELGEVVFFRHPITRD